MLQYDVRVGGLDLDGTVFDDNKNISPRTVAAIRAACEKGVAVLPATGRFLKGLPESFVGLPGVRYALTSNGASVVELATGRKLVEQNLPDEMAAAVTEYLMGCDCMCNAFIGGCGWASDRLFPQLHEWYGESGLESYVRSFEHPDLSPLEIVRAHPGQVEKISAKFRSAADRDRAAEAIAAFGCEISNSFSDNIEVNAPGVDKGSGLIALARALGYGPENVMAIGDSNNDIAMLRKAGLGVAMGNATAETIAAADVVTLSNNEDGVAAALEKYLL